MDRDCDIPRAITVVGGGIMGLTMACTLLKQGFIVTLIDKSEVAGRASSATAGIIGGSSVIPWASKDLWLNMPSMLRNPNGPFRIKWPLPKSILPFLAKSIKAGTLEQRRQSSNGLAELALRGWNAWMSLIDHYPTLKSSFLQNGCLLYYSNAQERFADVDNNAVRREMGMHLIGKGTKAVRDMLPHVSDPEPSGTFIEQAGQILDPISFQRALKDILNDGCGTFVYEHALGFITEGEGVKAVITPSGHIDCDLVVICAGTGSSALSEKLFSKVPILPAWGASVTFHEPDISLKLPILHQKAGFAVLPSVDDLRAAGLLKVGGLPLLRDEQLDRILIRQVKKLFGNFTYTGVTGQIGPRPLTPDSLPVLGRAPRYKNAYFNFGHGHWGVTHAAVSAHVILDLINGKTPEIDIRPYSAERFQFFSKQ
ncbi:MAG: FAD-binding oxidoreductase [Paracoccaceae bacterium]|nr:FAD-binding oxidoreductase [Paracoccaceae bacterium]